MVLGFNDRLEVPNSINESQRFGFVVCSMFCAIASGAVYSFSLISGKMTDDYGFTQNDITTVSTVGIVLGYFTLPFGFILDYIGPKPLFAIGIFAYGLGAALFALTFSGRIGASVGSLAVINAIMNTGCAMFDMGPILSVLSWFPVDRGLLVAAVKSMIGLASSVIATIYNTYFSGNHSTFMFFLLAVFVVIGFWAFIFIQIPPYHMTGHRIKHYTEEEHAIARRVEHMYLIKKAPRRRFLILFVIVLSLLIVITVQSIAFVFVEGEVPFKTKNPPAIIMILLCFSLFLVVLPFNCLDKPLRGSRKSTSGSNEPLENSNKKNDSKENTSAGDAKNEIMDEAFEGEERLVSNDDKNFPQYQTGFFHNVLHSIPLWCFWLNAVIVSGGVHIVMLNSRQLFVAVSEDPSSEQLPALYVALTSVGNAISRLGVSFFEAWNASRPLEKRTPITITYCIPSLMMCLSCIFFLIVPARALIVPMLFGGFANGSYAATLVLTVRTIFSIDVAKHYNSIFVFDLIGVIVFNRFMFGELMTRNSVRASDGRVHCLGRSKCVRTSFTVLACLCTLAFTASLLMHFVYMRFVRSRRVQEEAGRNVPLEMAGVISEEVQ
ncbi:hypothetical protein TcYC6_0066990 [Trypanosoma cruzi]|nr:hypothetical protein TcYC6_0066990 [Trypanosoma cruzi]